MKRRDWHFGDLANHPRQAWSEAFDGAEPFFLRLRAKSLRANITTWLKHALDPHNEPYLALRLVELITLDPRSRLTLFRVPIPYLPIQEMQDKWGLVACGEYSGIAGSAAGHPQAPSPHQTAALSTVVPNAIQ
jgi:hypothetical protein